MGKGTSATQLPRVRRSRCLPGIYPCRVERLRVGDGQLLVQPSTRPSPTELAEAITVATESKSHCTVWVSLHGSSTACSGVNLTHEQESK
eukprot:1417489-Amphidinium_carterae.1